jgi:hypothetical protein
MSWIRDLSLILLVVEAFFLALVPLVLFGGLVYGLWWLQRHENLPTWLRVAQAYVSLVQAYVELAMRTVARPILRVHATLAMVQSVFGGVAKLAKGRQ